MSDAKFYLHHHPSQKVLVNHLIGKLAEEGKGDVFYQSQVLVSNQGMARWIKRELASSPHEIAMQVEFPHRNNFLQRVIKQASVSSDELLWRVYSVLPKVKSRKAFSSLKAYLEADHQESALRQYQLASKIAALLDQYLLYRPDWIAQWNNNEPAIFSPHEPWQRELWREIGGESLFHWVQHIGEVVEEGLDHLPEALHIFGVSTFAPSYLQFLYALSKRIPVHFYWLNPVKGYWGDAPSKRRWILENSFIEETSPFQFNPLLATFGQMGREYIHNIYGGRTEEFLVQEEELDSHSAMPITTRLAQVQADLAENAMPSQTPYDDRSISIHACHSPMREVQTLKTYLLDCATRGELEVGEVLVMCTDISVYAPAIEAVFGSHNEGAEVTLPYRIADCNSPQDNPNISVLSDLLRLRSSRFTNQDALTILQTPAIMEGFQITQDDIPKITEWINHNGIRWGINSDHVGQKVGLEVDAPWTWEAGLERMLLGSTLPANNAELWRGIAPYTELEGGDLSVLNSLCSFIQWAKQIHYELGQSHDLTTWIERTRQWVLKGFSAENDYQRDVNSIYRILDEAGKSADFLTDVIPSSVFAEHLLGYLQEEGAPRGFLSGNITFCEAKPMRSVPAHTLCMLGMNYDAFPRNDTQVQFDLTQKERREGDRSVRVDDLYLFLETILSAQKNLFISYVGFSIKDGSALPPSTSVQSFMDYIPGLDVQEERLHAFDPDYFRVESPVSFDSDLCLAAKALLIPPADVSHPTFLRPTAEPVTATTFEVFYSVLSAPCKHYFKSVLQGAIYYETPPFDPNEPLDIEGLGKWRIRNDLLHSDLDRDVYLADRQQKAHLPPAEIGQGIYDEIESLVARVKSEAPEVTLIEVKVTAMGLTISAQIPVATSNEGEVIIVSSSNQSAKDKLKLRVYQLLLSAHLGRPACATLHYPERENVKQLCLSADEDYRADLEALITLFQEAHTRPLPHFPKTAEAYWTEVIKPGEEGGGICDKARGKALLKWLPSYNDDGEKADASIPWFFPADDPITADFLAVTQLIWVPLLNHLTKP